MLHLQTYMQVSDLHFTSRWQQRVIDPWAQHVPGLPGLVGHTVPTLHYLQSAFTQLAESEPGTELIVTGDLTAFGAPGQFQEADDYLGKRNTQPPFLGLDCPDWAQLSVPGNHDFWSGVACVGWGFTNGAVRKRYPRDAWITPAFTLPNGRRLVFLHLNGDADVTALSPERVYACGSFCSAIRQLDALLAERNEDEVRVLLLHHSVQYEGDPVAKVSGSRWLPVGVSLTLKHLSINEASRVELAAFVAKYDVRLILTGHVHHPPFLGRITTGAFAAGPGCWESCCGTTTQRSSPAAAGFLSENGLVVHRLQHDGAGQIYWRSEAHALLLAGTQLGFQPFPAPAPPHTTLYIRLSP